MKKYIVIIILGITSIFNTVLAENADELMRKSGKSLDLGKYQDALTFAQQALDAEKQKNGTATVNYATILGRLGNIHYSSGDIKKAEEYFQSAIKSFKEMGKTNEPGYAITLNDMACVYQYLGRFLDAEKLLNDAFTLKKDNGDVNNMTYAISLHNAAKLKQVQGFYGESEELYKKALEIKAKTEGLTSATYATTLLNLGLLYQELGNYDVSKKNIEKAVNIYETELEKTNPLLKSAKLQLALVHVSLNDNDKAYSILSTIDNPEKIFQNNHPDYASVLYNIAMLYWSKKNYTDAKRLLEQAMASSEKQLGKGSTFYSSCLNSLGLVCWAGKMYNTAYQYLNQAVKNRKEIYGENNPKYTTSLHNLAGLLSYMGKKKEAEALYLQSLKLYQKHIKEYFPFLSEKEKTSFYAMIKERLDLFYCYVLENYKNNPSLIGEMFNTQLACKAILLKDILNLRNTIKKTNDEKMIVIFDKWQKIKEELSTLYNFSKVELKAMGRNLDALENEANQLEKELSQNCKIFNQEYIKVSTTWKDIQKQLKGDEAVIDIIRFSMFRGGWTDQIQYIALIITNETKDYPELIVLDKNNQLESMYIKNYNNSIRFKIDDNDSYNAFWKNIDEYLGNRNKIYISPDGAFNKININTLRKPDGSYVLDTKEITMVSNTSDILGIKNDKSVLFQNKTASIFGYPKQSENDKERVAVLRNWKDMLKSFNIEELPQTKVEVTELEKVLTSNQFKTSLFIENNANEYQFKKMTNTDIIHIATHGFFLTDFEFNNYEQIFGIDVQRFIDDPLLRSGLVLSEDDKENGILSAFEVKNMDFGSTDLAVLSACETGAGEIKNGEGVYGLQRAFQIAGAKNVVMSLWKVDDIATQEFMGKFYDYLLQGSKPAVALKLAQMKTKEKYAHPYYWGAFVLITN